MAIRLTNGLVGNETIKRVPIAQFPGCVGAVAVKSSQPFVALLRRQLRKTRGIDVDGRADGRRKGEKGRVTWVLLKRVAVMLLYREA